MLKGISEHLKNKRLKEGLSIRQLSTVIGVSFSAIARIERGETYMPQPEVRRRIERWLVDGTPSAPRTKLPNEPWHKQVERRLAAIEKQLGMVDI